MSRYRDSYRGDYRGDYRSGPSRAADFGAGQPPPNIEGMFSLKVDNITYRTTVEDLRQLFSKYGETGDIYIPRDRYSHESRGFAFVRFFHKRHAEDAVDELDGKLYDGRDLGVQFAKYNRPAETGFPRGGRGGGGGRYDDRRYDDRYDSRRYDRRRSRSPSRERRRRSSRDRDRDSPRRRHSRGDSRDRSRSRSRSPARNGGGSRSRD